jgi:hypothetical protein
LCAITGGLRVGELLGMKWANLDENSGKYYVKEALIRSREKVPAWMGPRKTESSVALVDLPSSCFRAIEQQRFRGQIDR